MKFKRALKIGVISLVVLLALGGVAVGVLYWQIEQSVQQHCAVAQELHPSPGDDVGAVMSYMNSDEHTLRERNLAVWTLGRLGDVRGLTALQAVYTGERCNHERFLCQYELTKAIKLCGGNPDPPRQKGH